MRVLIMIIVGLVAALLVASFMDAPKWLTISALVVVLATAIIAAAAPLSQGIQCDIAVPGGARNNEVLCMKTGVDRFRCYMPNAGCDRVAVRVEVVDDVNVVAKKDAFFSENDMFVTMPTTGKTYMVSAELPSSPSDASFIGLRDMPSARAAYEAMPFPLIRAVVGSVLAGG